MWKFCFTFYLLITLYLQSLYKKNEYYYHIMSNLNEVLTNRLWRTIATLNYLGLLYVRKNKKD